MRHACILPSVPVRLIVTTPASRIPSVLSLLSYPSGAALDSAPPACELASASGAGPASEERGAACFLMMSAGVSLDVSLLALSTAVIVVLEGSSRPLEAGAAPTAAWKGGTAEVTRRGPATVRK